MSLKQSAILSKNTDNILFLLTSLLMPWMFYIYINDKPVNISLADFALILWGIWFLINSKKIINPDMLKYVLYFFLLIISLIISHTSAVMFKSDLVLTSNISLLLEILKVMVVACYFFTALFFIKNYKKYNFAIKAFAFGGIPATIISFIAYAHFLLDKPFFIKALELNDLRFTAYLNDANLCAFYFILVFFSCILIYKTASKKWLSYIALIYAVLCVFIIIITVSRGGWIALAASCGFLVVLKFRILFKDALIMVLLFITMTFIIISFDISYQSGTITRLAAERISRPVRQGQEIDRIVLSKAALDMGNDNFLTGVGKGNYVLNFLDYTDSKVKPTIPHNTLLGYYAEQGILGAIIFILLPGYLILKLFKSKKEKESGYFLAMIIGIAISSLSLNLENIRFMWLLIGIFIGWIQIEKDDIKKETQYIGNKTFIIIVIVLVPVFVLSYFQAARRFVIDIYAYEGGRYEKSIAIQEPGEYSIDFDIRTDNNDHRVEIYQGDDLVDILEFNNANGKISYPVELQKDVLLKFISSNDGWMRVYNATVSQGKEFKKSMQNYALLPSVLQKILDKNNQLKIYMVTSANSPIIVEENLFDKIKVLEARVIKHANYSFAFEFDYECLDEIDVLYQIQMLLHYDSLTDIFPGVTQRNRITHRSTISSDIVNWQIGQVYTHRLQRLLLNDNFKLYGRFYNHPDQTYVQDSFFEIPYLLSYENQEKADLGNSDWINIHYSNSGINIQMNSNGWIESERYDLKQGKYKLIFSAYGSKLEDEYPMIQIRDSLFNEIGELYLNENMTEYAVDFNIDSDFDGLSFLFELVNYNSISGVGRRTAFAAPIYRLEQIE